MDAAPVPETESQPWAPLVDVSETSIRELAASGGDEAEAILVAHQRSRDGYRGCLCGWSELGKSHPGHQVAMLREAGLLAGGDTALARSMRRLARSLDDPNGVISAFSSFVS